MELRMSRSSPSTFISMAGPPGPAWGDKNWTFFIPGTNLTFSRKELMISSEERFLGGILLSSTTIWAR